MPKSPPPSSIDAYGKRSPPKHSQLKEVKRELVSDAPTVDLKTEVDVCDLPDGHPLKGLKPYIQKKIRGKLSSVAGLNYDWFRDQHAGLRRCDNYVVLFNSLLVDTPSPQTCPTCERIRLMHESLRAEYCCVARTEADLHHASIAVTAERAAKAKSRAAQATSKRRKNQKTR